MEEIVVLFIVFAIYGFINYWFKGEDVNIPNPADFDFPESDVYFKNKKNENSIIISFLKLIRLKNLIIITLTQLLIKFSLINPFLDNFILSNNQFYLLVLATIFITASGYIINDIYDVKTDKINKEDSRIIGKSITSRNAITWYILFNLLGLGLGVYIAYIVKHDEGMQIQ